MARKPPGIFPKRQTGTGSSGCFPRRPSRSRYLRADKKGAEEENEAEEEKVSEAWKRNPMPRGQAPEDQAAQPLIEVAEILETETARTFESAVRYDAAHGAEHAGITLLYAMEPDQAFEAALRHEAALCAPYWADPFVEGNGRQ